MDKATASEIRSQALRAIEALTSSLNAATAGYEANELITLHKEVGLLIGQIQMGILEPIVAQHPDLDDLPSCSSQHDQANETRDMDERFVLADAAYERGQYGEAFAKFLALAEDGDLSGMARVACMYADGEGTERSRDKSLEWDLKAAALGGETSMFNLGITYRNSGDMREAKRWFEKCHSLGDGDASLELAKMYMISELEGERIRAYLLAAVQSSHVCEASREEAQQLLDGLD